MTELKVLHRENVSGLIVYRKKKLENPNDYRFLVHKNATPHTAFKNRAGLNRYLRMTGQRVSKGMKFWMGERRLIGRHQYVSVTSQKKLDLFAKQKKLSPTKLLHNANIVRAYSEKRKGAGNKIYFVNVNYKPRILKYRND